MKKVKSTIDRQPFEDDQSRYEDAEREQKSNEADGHQCHSWMEWWMDGLIDGRMDWLMDGWMDWWMDGWIEGWMDWLMDGWMDWEMDVLMDGWIEGWMDWWMDWLMDGLIEGWMDGWFFLFYLKLVYSVFRITPFRKKKNKKCCLEFSWIYVA